MKSLIVSWIVNAVASRDKDVEHWVGAEKQQGDEAVLGPAKSSTGHAAHCFELRYAWPE